ncbi:MAG: AAA family ATPase [Betaproteobacteria bacterium]|nr:AAA family ATPase [Betaproteobacteria bacterium]
MALLDEILAWTEACLTPWQRDAARRLFQEQQGLSPRDYDDLYALMKSAHGLADPAKRTPVPLAAAHLPAHSAGAAGVVLKAMRELKNVNRIAANQILQFAPKGLTVIYGGNGSGKSGYSRVLKRACRARDQQENVLADATDAAAHKLIPEALFDIEVGGVAKTVSWKRGITPPDELSTIAVFDTHCARAYLTAEQDVAYLPYGLDVVENLANKVLPELARRLSEEIAGVQIDVEPFASLKGGTAVGQLVTGLSAKTNPEDVHRLAQITAEETSTLVELQKALVETDPRSKARAINLSAQRIEELVKRIDAAEVWVSDAAVAKLKEMDDGVIVVSQAEKVAAEQFRAGEALLPGTGEQVWKAMFDAARRFSTESAYQGHQFPHVEPGAHCVLCQQPIDNAADRMKRFTDFVQSDAAKVAGTKRDQLGVAVRKIEAARLVFDLDPALSAELAAIEDGLCDVAARFESAIEERRRWMLGAVCSHAWHDIPAVDGDPRERLRGAAAHLRKTATDLEKAADESKRKVLETNRDELLARTALGPVLNAIISLIERMRLKASLETCKDDLKTRAISDKSKEFASNAVTAALKDALDQEFGSLGMGHIRTKLSERNDKGKMKYRLLLDLPVTNKLDEILSEGEQRAIAIGAFLAELQLANHGGGIVFDDPVSSLDHWRRRHVARRLVEEGKCRQVIVLTHDTTFLGELRDAIEQGGVDHQMHHLEWKDNRPGFVVEGLPWAHKSYKERIDRLEKAQKVLERSWSVYPGEAEAGEMRHQYDFFRATIERVVQDLVLNGVVQRYRDWIRVDNLDEVVGFEATEHKEIARLYKRCCDVVDAHDPASAKNAPVPNPRELDSDLQSLKTLIEAIKVRRAKGKAALTTGVVPSSP